jgi:hypothetical protein
MNKPISGLVTVGLVFGLLQFVTTFAITFIYARWASRTFDPAAEKPRRPPCPPRRETLSALAPPCIRGHDRSATRR